MRKLIACTLGGCLVMAAGAARADSYGGCFVGPDGTVNRCVITGLPAAGLAAVAAPILVVGAAVTIAHELHKSDEAELPPGTVVQPNKKKPSLSYVPAANGDPYYNREHAPARRSAAFTFNETAANVMTAVTAAAVVGAVIATVAGGNKGGARR